MASSGNVSSLREAISRLSDLLDLVEETMDGPAGAAASVRHRVISSLASVQTAGLRVVQDLRSASCPPPRIEVARELLPGGTTEGKSIECVVSWDSWDLMEESRSTMPSPLLRGIRVGRDTSSNIAASEVSGTLDVASQGAFARGFVVGDMLKQGDYDRAEEEIRRLTTGKDLAAAQWAHRALAFLLLRRGAFEDGIQEARSAITGTEENSGAHMLLAYGFWRAGEREHARRVLVEALTAAKSEKDRKAVRALLQGPEFRPR